LRKSRRIRMLLDEYEAYLIEKDREHAPYGCMETTVRLGMLQKLREQPVKYCPKCGSVMIPYIEMFQSYWGDKMMRVVYICFRCKFEML